MWIDDARLEAAQSDQAVTARSSFSSAGYARESVIPPLPDATPSAPSNMSFERAGYLDGFQCKALNRQPLDF